MPPEDKEARYIQSLLDMCQTEAERSNVMALLRIEQKEKQQTNKDET